MGKPKLTIVKIGGNVLDDAAVLSGVLKDFAALDDAKILVHGGGKIATRIGEKLGLEAQFHNGRRITDQAMRDVAVMTYAGLTNKTVVARLQSFGLNAIGLSGADGNLIRSKKRAPEPIDFGWVGDVETVDSEALSRLLSAGFHPVFSAITHDGNGNLLNTNADTIAAELAMVSASAYDVRLLFCFEKDGVLRDSSNDASVIDILSSGEFSQLKAAQAVHSGMLPKLENCFRALEKGVAEVRIGSVKMLTDNGSGTRIST